MGPPWVPGVPISDPLGIFSKCVFLNLLNPLRLPIPSNTMVASKKLKIFPRGCERQRVHSFQFGVDPESSSYLLLGDTFRCARARKVISGGLSFF